MKTMFRFRLARVLDYRRRREERLEGELRQRQYQLKREESQLAAFQSECYTLEERLMAAQGTPLFGEDVQRWRRYYQKLKQNIVAQEVSVAEAAKAVTAARQALLTARQEKKILEKLEDKAYQQYLQERTHREQQQYDELAIMRSHYAS